jgi:hypothetical protein
MRIKRWIYFILIIYIVQYIVSIGLDYCFLQSSIYKSAVMNSELDELSKKDILILGGSNGLVSFDNKILEDRLNADVYNLSEDDTNLKLHLLQLKYLISHSVKPKVIILALGSMENGLSRNSLRYLPYFSTNKELSLAYKEFQSTEYYSFKIFPIFKWAKYNNDLLYPTLFSTLYKKNYRHRFDENGDYEYPVLLSKIESSHEDVKLDSTNPDLKQFMNLCESNGIRLVTVNTPYYDKKINWDMSQNDVLNYSEVYKLRDDLFYDASHLNKVGKIEFSKLIADSLSKML